MKKQIHAAIVVAANAIDLASTYYVSPDLANEWNVLERIFGLGWAGLIIAKLLGGAFAIAGYGYYLRYREQCYPSAGARFGMAMSSMSKTSIPFGSRCPL